jgi:SAM-dependent methyltransferase
MTVEDPGLLDFRARRAQQRALAYTRFFSPITCRFVPAVVERLDGPTGPALDLGCGDGSLAASLRRAAWRVVAVDVSPALAAVARTGTGVPAVVGDALRLPFADHALAAVGTLFVLPHLDDLDVGLREVHRVLRPGGRLVMAGWAPPAASELTGLAGTLLRERASPEHRAALAEADRRTDAAYLCDRLAAAGFADPAVHGVAAEVVLPSVRDWWKGLVGASCGFGDLYRAQTTPVQTATREAFEDAAAERARPDGSVPATAAALVLSCRREL